MSTVLFHGLWLWNSTVLTDLEHLYRIYSNPTRHTRQDRWIQTELTFTLAKNATKPNPIEIIPLQTTRKENNWKTEETLARTIVTLETERIKLVQSFMFIMMMTTMIWPWGQMLIKTLQAIQMQLYGFLCCNKYSIAIGYGIVQCALTLTAIQDLFQPNSWQTRVAAVTVYSATDDGCKGRPKHVEHTCSC